MEISGIRSTWSAPLPRASCCLGVTTVIRDEHRAYAALLHGALALVQQVKSRPDADALQAFRAIVDYLDAFPERFHHPKEDRYLFRLLRVRCPGEAPLLDRLAVEHIRSRALAGVLSEALSACEQAALASPAGANGGDLAESFRAFTAAIGEYEEFHQRHMRCEEEEVLPLAEEHLTAADWTQIEAAYRGYTDPLLGASAEAEFGRMLKRIVMLAPTPVGVRQRN